MPLILTLIMPLVQPPNICWSFTSLSSSTPMITLSPTSNSSSSSMTLSVMAVPLASLPTISFPPIGIVVGSRPFELALPELLPLLDEDEGELAMVLVLVLDVVTTLDMVTTLAEVVIDVETKEGDAFVSDKVVSPLMAGWEDV